jgi:hypothetical protein
MKRALALLQLLATSCATTGVLRKEFNNEAIIHARPERIFPLLCPIKENEWIDGWRAEVLHSKSGFAEDNALFRTRLRFGETWITTRYEPQVFRVEYTIFAGGHAIVRLDLALDDLGDGTSRLRARRTYSGLDWLGRHQVEVTRREEIDAAQDLIARQLDHYVTTGTVLRSKATPKSKEAAAAVESKSKSTTRAPEEPLAR